jgi:NAD(P)-dependent dehydrogenase (short-subunit alcohol dehydrogenase family)
MANISPTPKGVALVLFPALVLTLAFAFSYVGAFHDPTPHHVPVAVVGPPAVAAQLNHLPGEPLDARQAASRADALSQIDDDDASYEGYAALEPVGRLGAIDDIVEAILYLERATFVTGEILHVDGGQAAGS